MDKQEYALQWDHIYRSSQPHELIWYQPDPIQSLKMIETSGFSKESHILDVGAGDCFLAEKLVEAGYQNISVLDISEVAIEKAQKRMGDKSKKINWICKDIFDFTPSSTYDLWHDRAFFHFLTQISDVKAYKQIAHKAINSKGKIMLAVFSELGPGKCSGLPVTQYSESTLNKLFSPEFHMIRWQYCDHMTPSKNKQHYIYSCFSKMK